MIWSPSIYGQAIKHVSTSHNHSIFCKFIFSLNILLVYTVHFIFICFHPLTSTQQCWYCYSLITSQLCFQSTDIWVVTLHSGKSPIHLSRSVFYLLSYLPYILTLKMGVILFLWNSRLFQNHTSITTQKIPSSQSPLWDPQIQSVSFLVLIFKVLKLWHILPYLMSLLFSILYLFRFLSCCMCYVTS